MDIAIVGSGYGFMSYQQLADRVAGIADTRKAMAGGRVAPGKLWQA